jgi:ACS family hexuronate transporter-like MFS transporter
LKNAALPRLRWLMIGLAFLATMINYLDRQTLSVAAPLLRDQFHISNVGYSRIVFAFMLAYTVMNGASGPLLDRLGTRLGYALCMLWWSTAALLHAFSTGIWSLATYRFLLGMGEAGNWPAAVKLVSEWFPPQERAMAAGIFNSGSAVGAILTPPLIAWIILRSGWRQAFCVVGIVGFLWLLLWVLLYRTPPETRSGESKVTIPMGRLVRKRLVVAFTLSKVFMDPVWYFYIFWFPEYLKRVRHFDLASIGKYAWIPFLAAGFGNLLGGGTAAVLLRRNVPLSTARKVSVSLFVVLMLGAIPAVLTDSPWISIVWVSIAMIGYTGSLANMLAIPADVFPSSAVGSVYGIASMGSGLGGMVFGLLTGWVIDHYSYTPVFIGFGLMPLVCAGILWTILGPISTMSAAQGLEPG